MANTIRPKRSYTAASVPAASIAGELSINAADGKIWITNAAATSQILVSSLNRSDHTGTLAVTSGGTGVTTSTGSGSNVLSTSPTLVTPVLGTPSSGNLTNCTFPTLNQNTTGTAAGLSATLAISSGGTGATSANAAANAILPSQASNSGKYLTTNGTDSSWGTVSAGTTLPAGSMQMFAGAITQSASSGTVTTNAPSGWLLANGDLVSRSTFSALFSAIGTAFGAGNGSTTFALPDMRGRVGFGVGTGSGLTARTLAGTVGTESETLTSAQIPAHSHPNTVGSTAGGSNNATGGMSANTVHNHGVDRAAWTNSGSAPYTFTGGGSNIALQNIGINNSSSLDHTHAVFITNANNTGGGGSHNNMQPSIGLNFIIKT